MVRAVPEGDPGWWRWKPFERGHQLSTVHGATSERHLRPMVDELLEWVRKVAPWCNSPVHEPTVIAWAYAEATVELYRRHFNAEGLGLDAEEPTKGVDRWHRAERHAIGLREQLGLGPMALTKLLSGVSSLTPAASTEGLAELAKVGAQIRQAIEAGAAELEQGGSEDAGGEVVEESHI